MQLMKKYTKRLISSIASIAFLALLVALVPTDPTRAAVSTIPHLMISEVQTGGLGVNGDEIGNQEFIELYNPTSEVLDVQGWRLEYLSANHNGTGPATRLLGELGGQITPRTYVLVSQQGFLDADLHFTSTTASGALAQSGGHVRIIDRSGVTIDVVTWGSGVPIGEWGQTPEIPPGSSIQRILPHEADFIGGGREFRAPSDTPTPFRGVAPLLPEANNGDDSSDPTCTGVIISEILPNPAGADAGHEYIELHNPTNVAVLLKGCSLRLGSSGTSFSLPDEVLPPGAYRPFSDTESGITLPNATAQTVWLLGTADESGVTYANELEDDTAWAFIDNIWQSTKTPTPGGANVLPSLAPRPAPTKPTQIPQPKPPKPAKPSAATTSCPAGKERNPATNRCRNITTAGAKGLIACQSGQERNPATNRCRNIARVAGATLKPCQPGQVRNPDTNRCRKASTSQAAAITKVEDVDSGSPAQNYRWWIAGLLVLAALGYALYEWRKDIANALHKIRPKIKRK